MISGSALSFVEFPSPFDGDAPSMSNQFRDASTARLLLCAKHNTGAGRRRPPVKGALVRPMAAEPALWLPLHGIGIVSGCRRITTGQGQDYSEQNARFVRLIEICGFFAASAGIATTPTAIAIKTRYFMVPISLNP